MNYHQLATEIVLPWGLDLDHQAQAVTAVETALKDAYSTGKDSAAAPIRLAREWFDKALPGSAGGADPADDFLNTDGWKRADEISAALHAALDDGEDHEPV